MKGITLWTSESRLLAGCHKRVSALDRAALVEGPISSLDKPGPALDALWLKEAESRIAAYHAGELQAVDAEEVFAELGRKA